MMMSDIKAGLIVALAVSAFILVVPWIEVYFDWVGRFA